jgi:hypothetical protein
MSKLLTLLEIVLTNKGANIVSGYGWYGSHDWSTCSKVSICVSPMVKLYVMGLSYHRWLEITAMFFFLLLILYAVIG